MDFLDRPYQFFHPQPERPFELPVVRWEVGLATRDVAGPPWQVQKPTIRFHLAPPLPDDLFLAVRSSGSAETDRISAAELAARPYLDFTNQILIKRILSIYADLLDRPITDLTSETVARMEALSPQRERPLVLRLTRHGLQIDTVYDVQVVGP